MLETMLIILLVAAVALGLLWLVVKPADMSRYDSPTPALVVQPDQISAEHQAVLQKLKNYHAGPVTRDIARGREKFAGLFDYPIDPDVLITPVRVGNMNAEWVRAENADADRRLLYLHGGAFMVGSPSTHRFITTRLARETGASVLAVDYRKMPEHRVADAHEDARTAYRWILEQGPVGEGEPSALFIAGDSAGGALTLATLAWARDSGLRQVDGAVGFAPATDATFSSPTWKTNAETDAFLGPGFGRVSKMPQLILLLLSRLQMGRPAADPMFSPLRGNLAQLPPTLIQVSTAEMLYGDAVRYTNRSAEAGSRVELEAWPELVHVFQLFGELPEAGMALDRAAAFLLKLEQ